MKRLKKTKSAPNHVPDYTARSIADIDFKALANAGIKYVAFDADHTLVHYRGIKLDAETSKYLQNNKKYFKDWCIASNRVTNDLQDIGADLKGHVIRASATVRKPSRKFYDRVIAHFQADPSEIVMIGDKLLSDVWGAKRMGLQTVWVEHLGKNGPLDAMIGLRRIERWLLRHYL